MSIKIVDRVLLRTCRKYFNLLPMLQYRYSIDWRHMTYPTTAGYSPVCRTARSGQENTRKPFVTGPLWGESTDDQWLPSQIASEAENVSMSWRHHVKANAICVNRRGRLPRASHNQIRSLINMSGDGHQINSGQDINTRYSNYINATTVR